MFHYKRRTLEQTRRATNEWSLDFTSDPTQVDTNGNGQSDWALTRPGTISPASLSASAGSPTEIIDQQQPGLQLPNGNAHRVLRAESSLPPMKVLSSVSIYCEPGATGVPLTVRVKKMPDGTQSVWLQARTASRVLPLCSICPRQPNQSIQVKLIVDPVVSAVAVFVGEVAYGTFAIVPYASSQTSQRITLGASGRIGLDSRLSRAQFVVGIYAGTISLCVKHLVSSNAPSA